MTWKEQEELFDKVTSEMKDLLVNKGREYASDKDSLANFKAGAEDIGISPLQIAWIFYQKHASAVKSYIRTGKEFSSESIEGRLLDMINYSFLIMCLIKEQKEATTLVQLSKAE